MHRPFGTGHISEELLSIFGPLAFALNILSAPRSTPFHLIWDRVERLFSIALELQGFASQRHTSGLVINNIEKLTCE